MRRQVSNLHTSLATEDIVALCSPSKAMPTGCYPGSHSRPGDGHIRVFRRVGQFSNVALLGGEGLLCLYLGV